MNRQEIAKFFSNYLKFNEKFAQEYFKFKILN